MEKKIDENTECKPESSISKGGTFRKWLRSLLQHQFLLQLAIITLIIGWIYPVYKGLRNMERTIAYLQAESQLLRNTVSKMESELRDKTDLHLVELQVVKDAVHNMKTEFALLKNKLGSIESEVNDIKVELENVKQGKESTKNKVENMIEDLQIENSSLRIEISNVEAEIRDVKSKFYTAEEERQIHHRRLESTIKDLKTEITLLLGTEISEVKSQINDVMSTVHMVKEAANNHQSKVETSTEALNAEVKLLKKQISKKGPEFGDFKTKLQFLKEELNNLQKNYEISIKELKAEIMLLKSEIGNVKPEIHDVKSNIYSVEEGLKSSQRQFESLEIKSTYTDTVTKELFKNFTRTENELDKHKSSIQHLLSLTQTLKEELEFNINTLQVGLQTRPVQSACQSGYHIGRSDSRARIIFPFHVIIQFDPPFKNKPAFSYGLTYLHSVKHLSVNVELISLTEESFKLNFVSWGGEELYGARVSWIACPK